MQNTYCFLITLTHYNRMQLSSAAVTLTRLQKFVLYQITRSFDTMWKMFGMGQGVATKGCLNLMQSLGMLMSH